MPGRFQSLLKFKLTFHKGVSQMVLRRCVKALEERACSRQRLLFDWGTHFGNMSSEGAFLLIAYRGEHTETWSKTRTNLMSYIGSICTGWDFCVFERYAPRNLSVDLKMFDGFNGLGKCRVLEGALEAFDDPSEAEIRALCVGLL